MKTNYNSAFLAMLIGIGFSAGAQVITITPPDSATNVATDLNPTIAFSQDVRLIDDTAINDTNVDALVVLRIGDENGAAVPFDATFAGNVITIDPVAGLANDQDYYVALLPNVVENLANNAVDDITEAYFTTAAGDTDEPVVTITPVDSAIDIAIDVNPTISFDEDVRLADNSAIDDTNVDALVELRIGDENGALVPFDATFANNMITINPAADLANDQDYYVALLANVVEDLSDNAVSDITEAFFTTLEGNTDIDEPVVTFAPADVAVDIAIDVNPTIAFNEDIRLADDSAIDDTNVDALVELRLNNENGALVPFDATFAGNVITINPTADLDNDQDYYVALLGNAVEDLSDNAVTDTESATFTTIAGTPDIDDPIVTIIPADASVDVAIDVNPTIAFNEDIRLTDDSAIDDTNVDALVELRLNDENGALVSFDATFGGNVITINPAAGLDNDQDYYVALLGNAVEDFSDNAVTDTESATFTTIAGTPDIDDPIVTIVPADASVDVAIDVNPTIAFNENVRLTDDSAIDDTNVDALVELRLNDENGALVPFDATFAGNVITINPAADLDNGQDYYVALLPNVVEDLSDNAVADTESVTFTTIAGTPDIDDPIVTIIPADASVDVAIDVNPTIAFNENVRLTDDSAIDDTNVDALVELRLNDENGALVPFDATFAGNVITINPAADLDNGQDYYVALLPNVVEDLSDNAVADTESVTFTTIAGTPDIDDPIVTIIPADASVDVAIDVNPTIAFNENVRLTDDSAIDDTNVDALVELRLNDENGALVPFDATFAGNVITINPAADLANGQDYYVALLPNVVEDLSDNAVADTESVTFTTIPGTPDVDDPIVTITPADASIDNAIDVNPTIAFNENVRLTDDSAIDDTNVDTLVELRIGDENGALVPFDATFAGNVITINPTADLAYNQDYYVALLPNVVEDLSDNAVADIESATFTTAPELRTKGFAADNSFVMYPNPSQGGMVYFNKTTSVSVFDATGKMLFSANDVTSIDVSGLSAGLYLVKTSQGGTARLMVK